jgi:hypothetical protein
MSNIEQSVAEHVNQAYPQGRGREPSYRDPVPGLLVRAQGVLEEVTKLEEQLQSLLSRVRGSNVSHLNDPAKEPAPAGLPGIHDQLERRLKNSAKLLQDLSDMF